MTACRIGKQYVTLFFIHEIRCMINISEVLETNKMIEQENLDVRTITLGISLLDCADSDLKEVNRKIYEKITTLAKDLVATGEKIEHKYGIPIVNKRISITPISLVGAAACKTSEDFVTIAKTLDRAAHTVGVNFIGGYSALVQKGFAPGDLELINSIPEALASTTKLCSSVNIGSTRAGINLDAVKIMGQKIKEAERQMVYEEYSVKLNDIIKGKVLRKEKNGYIVQLDYTEASLPATEAMPNDNFDEQMEKGEGMTGYKAFYLLNVMVVSVVV